MTVRPRRSVLFLPASNPRAIEKARTLPCDAVILDLEDSVAPDLKDGARDAAVAAVSAGGLGSRDVLVRVNDLASPWGESDCRAVAAIRPAGVVVPKVENADDIAAHAARIGDLPIWAMIETPGAALRLDAIAGAPGLAALIAGTNDLSKAMRAQVDRERSQLAPFFFALVAAARAHGRIALDGVCNDFSDLDRFAAECAQGASLGFDGKTLIHPAQIAACNAAYSPDPDTLARARAIVAAFAAPDAAGKGAIRLGGAMVERLHLQEAEHILALARAIEGDDA